MARMMTRFPTYNDDDDVLILPYLPSPFLNTQQRRHR
jgi:hypothetical protein